jgi:hypothetical protein
MRGGPNPAVSMHLVPARGRPGVVIKFIKSAVCFPTKLPPKYPFLYSIVDRTLQKVKSSISN